MKNRKVAITLSALLTLSTVSAVLPVWAEAEISTAAESALTDVETADSEITDAKAAPSEAAVISASTALALLSENDAFILPETWNDAAKQIYELLGITAQKATEGSSGNKSSSSSYLEKLISRGYLDEAYSNQDAEASITENEYADLLNQIFTILIENQEDADALSNDADSTEAKSLDPVLTASEEDLTIRNITADYLVSAKMSSLTLEQDVIEVLTLTSGGELALTDTSVAVLSVDTAEDLTISGNSDSSITSIVISDAGTLVIDGDLSVDTLILTGNASNLILNVDCDVINKTGETITYTDPNGDTIELASDTDDNEDSGSSHKSGSSDSRSSRSSYSESFTRKSGSGSSSRKSGSRSSSKSSDSSSEEEDVTETEETTTDTEDSETPIENDDDGTTAENETEDANIETEDRSEEDLSDSDEVIPEDEHSSEDETTSEIEEKTENDLDDDSDDDSDNDSEDADNTDNADDSETTEKITVEVPVLETVAYTGELQIADIEDTEYYTVTVNEGGIEAGTYTVVLSLVDSEQYRWETDETGDAEELYLVFIITEYAEK